MENINNEFCTCKYNKKDGSIEYRAKKKHSMLKIIKKHKGIIILISLSFVISIINTIYIWNFYNIIINL